MERIIIHACISGFRQSAGSWNGTLTVRELLVRNGHSLGVESRVDYYTWNSRWRDVAEYYSAISSRYNIRPTIVVHAYSWGAGYGAMSLAKCLRRRGLRVKAMVLCDPVYKDPNILFVWRSLSRWNLPFLSAPKILVPSNVDYVCGVRQCMARPMGHELVACRNADTKIDQFLELPADHTHIHDQPEWHQMCLDVARQAFEGVL